MASNSKIIRVKYGNEIYSITSFYCKIIEVSRLINIINQNNQYLRSNIIYIISCNICLFKIERNFCIFYEKRLLKKINTSLKKTSKSTKKYFCCSFHTFSKTCRAKKVYHIKALDQTKKK